ncbi:unnamed protein product [Owenia fusiformis]|uniref:Uncharacterized protein n=1 Tax=Owenia fusiformis TaxID=6347 RepID=A0A8J1URA5_OWEFU|nr:unnamed protein product [Owenia fusiformis]
MASNVKEEDFTSGSRSVAYASKSSQAESKGMKNARSILWKHLHGTAVKTVVLESASYDYLTSQFDVTAQDHHKQLLHCPLQYEGSNYLWSTVVHSNIQDKSSIPENSTILNSVLGQNISIEGRSVMSHCNLVGQTNLHIGSQSIVSGLISEDLEPQQPPCAITLPNDIVLQGFHIKIPTLQGESKHQHIMTVFGKYDHLLGPTYKGSSSYCNTPWVVFMNRTGISQEDLWDSTVPDDKKCSMNAKLFPLFHVSEYVGIREILWLAGDENINIDSNVLDRWRSSWRLSFEEILNFIDLQAEFQHRRKLFFEIAKIDIVNTLEGKNGADINKGLCNVYASAVAEGLHFEVLETLDQVAMETSSAGVAARTLANIADVLGCMARNNGGLRSGPAANKSWGRAFHLLENGSIREGVSAMSEERAKWLERPDLLVRAARHYEGAAQILIRHAVMSARQFISTTKSELPPIGRWVMAECPARIDLSGGWSDTPPITYEHGGAVTNVSVLYDGKKPIGAKARRIERPEIVLHLEGRELVLTELSHLEDYCQPYAPGALLKACILCAELVDFPSDVSLREQLLQRYNGGIELHSWSQLPHGSGLGGSSILAGAVMGVLWNISGQAYDNKSLIHAVLHLEQMLTTGGGWQDQVGALVGGVKIGVSKGELPLYVDIVPLDVTVETVQAFSDRLILVYTGKTRLARNLLQNVIRNWYGRNPDILATQDALVENAHDCAKAFEQGDLEKVGECMNKYWEQKKKMAPGCEPSVVARMMASLREHTYGMTLAGAGGGGFMYVLMKNPGGIGLVKEILSQIEGTENATVQLCRYRGNDIDNSA